MRTFYLFEIKDSILKTYKYNQEELYSLLLDIHLNADDDLIKCYEVFKTIVNSINKEKYSSYIKNNNICFENYICFNNIHNYNDYYTNESTKLFINNSYIKIDTNTNTPSFFKDMRVFKNIFVCDFDNNDYFMLKDACLIIA